MSDKLKNALVDQRQQTEKYNQKFSGILGIPLGGQRVVEVAGRKSYVYIRLRNSQSEVIQAFNNKVAPSYNLPVLVERQGNRYVVVDVDTKRYDNNWSNFSPYLPRHGNTHSFDLESGGGGDIVWVYPRQFMPLLAFPSGSVGSPNVIVSPYTLKKENGTWMYVGNTGTASFTPYNPTTSGSAVMGLIILDTSSGNPYFLIGSGTPFASNLTGTSQVYPYIPTLTNPAHIPIAAVRLISGTTRLSWDNIYDLRQFVHSQPSGSAGSSPANPPISGSVVIQDEGAIQGSALALNFVGSPVSVSVVSGTATVTVTATASGSSGGATFTGSANSIVVTDSSGNLNTPDWLKWGTSTGKFVDFGADIVGREANAGRMGYNAFGDGFFDIVGAGTGSGHRRVRILDHLRVEENLVAGSSISGTTVSATNSIYTPAINIATGSTYNIGGGPHVHVMFDDAEGDPAPIASGAVDGTSTFAARRDHVHKGSYGSVMIYPTHALNNTVTASSTEYLCPFVDGDFTTERAMVVLRAGTVRNFFVRQTGNQPASGSLVCHVRKNVASDEITVTIAAGALAGQTHSDTSDSFSVVAGDFVGFKFVNNATAASATIGFVAVEFIADP